MNHKRGERIRAPGGSEGASETAKEPSVVVKRHDEYSPESSLENHVWSDDFVHERTHDGRAYRILVIIDEFSGECLALRRASWAVMM